MEELEKVKSISIKTYLEELYGARFRRVGSRWFCLSPLREERNPSFSVNLEENLWYDFGAAKGGDIITLAMILHDLSFREAVEHLLNYIGYVRPPRVTQKVDPPRIVDIEKLYANLKKHSRKFILEKYFADLGVRYPREAGAVEYRTLTCDFVAFPCPTPERILGLELRAVDEKKRLTLGRKYPWILYRGSQAVLTESILDCLAAERLYGTHLTLISLNGVGCAKYTPEIVKHYGIKNVMLAVDADAAGQECQERILSLLRGVTVEVIDDHGRAGVKDLYALLKKYQEQGGSHAGGNYRENSGV